MAYALGAVKPWVQAAAEEVGSKYSVATIYGVGQRSGPSDHPKGLALDFMVGTDEAKGDAIAAYIIANWDRLGVSYLIWKQRIKSSKTGPWVPMEDRGGVTENHFDHDHVSFNNRQPTGGGPIVDVLAGASSSGTGAVGGSGSVSSVLGWMGDGANWTRVLLVILGGILCFMAATLLIRGSVVSTIKGKVLV